MPPKITPYQFNAITQQISDIYVVVEDRLFEQVVKRLKAPKQAEKDYVLEWQAEKMAQLRMLNAETIELLAEASGILKEEVEAMFADVGYSSIESMDEQVARLGMKKLSAPTNIDSVLESYVRQVFRDFDNYVNETMITTTFGEGTVAKMYRKVVEETTAQVLTGNLTINQAMAETVIKYADKGIESGFVDKAGRTWHVEQYTQTVLRSTVNNTYNDLRLNRMQDYGIDLVLVSSHAAARPACARIQGGVCSMSNPSSNPKYPSIYEFGYGRPDGIRGINCSHILYPFIDGLNVNNQIQVDESKASEQYELTQKQRYYERQIRKAKRSLKLAETAEDEKAIEKYKQLVKDRQRRVREFVAENDLPRRYDKERIIL